MVAQASKPEVPFVTNYRESNLPVVRHDDFLGVDLIVQYKRVYIHLKSLTLHPRPHPVRILYEHQNWDLCTQLTSLPCVTSERSVVDLARGLWEYECIMLEA